MTLRILGISSKTGDLHELFKMKSKGKYQIHFGKTSEERKRKSAANPKLKDTIEEALEEIRNGGYPRMENLTQTRGGKKQAPDILAPSTLVVLRQGSDGSWIQEKI